MNFAHLHLILNHIPIVGIPVALAFLAQGLWTRNASTQRFSLLMLLTLALVVIPVFLTGEPAEEVVEPKWIACATSVTSSKSTVKHSNRSSGLASDRK